MKAPTLQIDRVGLEEIELLFQLTVNTFTETFEKQNSIANLQLYIKEQLNPKQLLTELKNPDSFFYFARHKEEIVGYLKLNFNQAQNEAVLEGKAFEIERIYIRQTHQRKGWGSQLFNKAIELGKEKGYTQLWLGVWEHNEKALAFYKRKGGLPFSSHLFQLGEDPQKDILMQFNI